MFQDEWRDRPNPLQLRRSGELCLYLFFIFFNFSNFQYFNGFRYDKPDGITVGETAVLKDDVVSWFFDWLMIAEIYTSYSCALLLIECFLQAPSPNAATNDAGGGPETGGGEDSKGDHPRIGSQHYQSIFQSHIILAGPKRIFPLSFPFLSVNYSKQYLFFQSPTLFLTLILPHWTHLPTQSHLITHQPASIPPFTHSIWHQYLLSMCTQMWPPQWHHRVLIGANLAPIIAPNMAGKSTDPLRTVEGLTGIVGILLFIYNS